MRQAPVLQALADLYTWSGLAHSLSVAAGEGSQGAEGPKEGSKEWVVEHVRSAFPQQPAT